MANTNIVTADATGFIPEVWLGMALGRLPNYLTYQKMVTNVEDLEGGAFTVGSKVHIPKRGTLVVNNKVENVNYTVQEPGSSTTDLTLNQHKEVTFGVESRVISTTNQNIIAGYADDAAIAIAEAIDQGIASVFTSVTPANTITNAGNITEGNILQARKILVDNKLPSIADRYAVVATSQTNALLGIDRFTRYDALGISNDIAEGSVGGGRTTLGAGGIGRIHGFNFSESQLVPVTGAGPYQAQNLFFGRDGIVFASRALELPKAAQGVEATVMTDEETGITLRMLHSYQHLMGAHVLTIDVLFGYQLLRPEHVVLVQTLA